MITRKRELWGTKQRGVALMTHIRGVRDELSKEDLLVRIERVDDEAHQLVDLSLEDELFDFGLLLRHFNLDEKNVSIKE